MVRCEFRRSHLSLLRNVLILLLFLVLWLPWVLISSLDAATRSGHFTLLESKVTGSSKLRVDPTSPVLHSCDDIFAAAALVRQDSCLQHQLLQWVACDIGPAWIQPHLVHGSVGGEDLEQVWNRP